MSQQRHHHLRRHGGINHHQQPQQHNHHQQKQQQQQQQQQEPLAINIHNFPRAMDVMEQITGLPPPSRLMIRSDATSSSATSTTSCAPNDNSPLCVKPTSESAFTLPIIIGITVPIIGSLITFLYLHRRHVKRQREEDANDRTNTMDFGLDHIPGLPGKRAFVEPLDERDSKEKGRSGRPRQLSMEIDLVSPYLLPAEVHSSRESLHSLSRTIHHNEDPYRPITQYLDDGKSIRSKPRHDGSSIYTTSSGAPSRLTDLSQTELLGGAARMPRSNPPSIHSFQLPPRYNSLPSNDRSKPPQSPLENEKKPYLIKPPSAFHVPAPPKPAELREIFGVEDSLESRNSNVYLGSYINSGPTSPALSPEAIELPQPAVLQDGKAPLSLRAMPTSPMTMPAAPFEVTPPDEDVPPAVVPDAKHAGLSVPGHDVKRLSMGMRPLPPSDIEGEDPEMRANRIRSFYKEYFDESRPAPAGQYYEDHDPNYFGDAVYYDPDSNHFVMPYSEPVTRRAMTPPPRGPPRGPRGRMGSMGAMSTMSANVGPRAASSVSQMRPGPRGRPARPMPPPQALSTLPTPGKLRDDSFALFGANEFAPPTSFRDRQAGRSESPLGARRPYSPSVASHTPLVSAFDELAPMPSPHSLRKSGTFTSLDFAAPRRLKDPDSTMSDAGSVRSFRSGISSVHHDAVRKGAYRVSRLPPDMVGTKDDIVNSLKPNWGVNYG